MNTPTTWTPPTPERDRQINIALVRAIQRFQERRAVQQAQAIGNRAALRDRMGQIVTIDRAGTARSISAPEAIAAN